MKLKSIFANATVIILLIVSLSGTFEVSGIKIDGNILNSEWEGIPKNALFDTKENSNCNVNAAVYRYEIDYDDNAIFFAIKCMSEVNSGELENHLNGIELKIDGEDLIRITADETYIFDDYKYSCDAAFSHGFGFQIEMRIGIKTDMRENYDVTIKIIDEFGSFSNEYDVVLIGKKIIDNVHDQTCATKVEQPKTQVKSASSTANNEKKNTTQKITTTAKSEYKTTEKHTIKDTANNTNETKCKAGATKNVKGQISNETTKNGTFTQTVQENPTDRNIAGVVLDIDNDNNKTVWQASTMKQAMIVVALLVIGFAIRLVFIAKKVEIKVPCAVMRTSEDK
ncbi:MAG TPA: hypothetical protein VFD52_05075 [Clostridia bacterium]|nr:hypothetical protein [Clostridia bacterium]